MGLTNFEIFMLMAIVLEGGVFIGSLFISNKNLKDQMDRMEKHQKEALREYKQHNQDSIDMLREDMRKYNNVLSRLAVAEHEIEELKNKTDTLQQFHLK